MKKYFFILIGFISNTGFAQSDEVKFMPYIGYSTQFLKASTYSKFVDSYNATNSNTLEKPLKVPNNLNGLTVGVCISSHIFYFFTDYNSIVRKNEVKFTTSETRTMRLSNNFMAFTFGINAGNQEGVKIIPFTGLSFGSSKVKSTFDPGTTNSKGEFLNGTYKTSNPCLIYGIMISGKENPDSPFNFFVKVQRLAPLYPTDLESKDNILHSSIATDYRSYVARPNSYFGDYVKADFKGFNLSFGIFLTPLRD